MSLPLETKRLLSAARYPCPNCKRKGVGYAPHPHARGFKDTDRLVCRYCPARFKFKADPTQPGAK